MSLGNSALVQHALAEFIERGYLAAHVKKSIPEYRRRRDAFESALRKYMPRDVTWQRPTHGVVLWLRLPPSIDPVRLFEAALERGVWVSVPTINTADGRPPPGIRLSLCGESLDRLVEGAKRLGKVAHAIASRPISRERSMLAAIGV